MGKRTLSPAGLVAFAAALCLIQPIRAQPIRAGAEDPVRPASAEAPFLNENAAAMNKMMAGMNVRPTGDVDADFAAMMIPHHQGAIDMAVAELRHGKNEQLRRISQEIIVEQQQEIAAMRLALGQKPPASAPAPTQDSASDAAAVPPPARASMPHGSMSMVPSMKMQ
jgi:hypothetical protein